MHSFPSKTAWSLLTMLLAFDFGFVLGTPLNIHYNTLRRDGNMTIMAGRANNTADTSDLKTWWQPTGEINTQTPVQPGNVRQSHKYKVQVARGSSGQYYDSFVYESIPRNGNGNICNPDDLASVCDMDDQISIEPEIGVTMAWTQFLYGTDVTVKVSRTDGETMSVDNVTIRPTNLGFKVGASGDSIYITVPHTARGYRFSVEFKDDLWTYRNAGGGRDSHYVQNVNPHGLNYVSAYTKDMPIVGVEPTNALLIFASDFPSSDKIPNDQGNTYNVKQGLVKDLSSVTQSILYFGPGVYWLTGSNHLKLPSSVSWVYIAPGAYVKGAIEYSSPSKDLRATGFGVLSGEQYVYQANTAQGYQNVKSDDTSLKMWRGQSSDDMTWTIHGLTTNAPPFNSMDFYGNMDTFSVQASDYKQVGAFFGQTDGIAMYPGSHVRDVFYHIGDDAIKTYHSNVLAERIVIWKSNNAPIVQFGWYQRNLNNVTVDSVDVIHARYISQADLYPRALVASAASYVDLESNNVADTSMHLTNYTISNWRVEGLSPALLGVNPLVNIDNFKIENVWMERMSPRTTDIGMSTLSVFTDEHDNPIKLGDNSPNKVGLTIKDFYVGKEHITLANNNWDSYSTGMLNIDESYWGRWTAI